MKNNRANRHNDRGFTLSEVLLTVAILGSRQDLCAKLFAGSG